MICVGLTGGIGSGKSFVANLFKRIGIPVYNADLRARYLMENDPKLMDQIKLSFGQQMYVNGQLQRKEMAAVVFHNKEKLSELNNLVHPAVRKDFQSWFEEQEAPYVIREAAILFESGSYEDCDVVVLVTAPMELRINRVMERDGVSREDVLKRMENQWDDEKKKKMSHFILENDGVGMLLPKIMAIHQSLIKISQSQ